MWMMKSERLIPIGAMNGFLDISASSMRIVKVRWAVRN
jgi:hypothetical protein